MKMKAEEIFDKYLDDKCPICNTYVDSDDYRAHTESGGKTMAVYFRCGDCHSEYTIGYNRNRMPIESEITLDNTPNK